MQIFAPKSEWTQAKRMNRMNLADRLNALTHLLACLLFHSFTHSLACSLTLSLTYKRLRISYSKETNRKLNYLCVKDSDTFRESRGEKL